MMKLLGVEEAKAWFLKSVAGREILNISFSGCVIMDHIFWKFWDIFIYIIDHNPKMEQEDR